MNRGRICAAIALVVLVVSASEAQDPRPPRGPAGQRVEQLKKLRLQEALALNEETSLRFFARYNEHQVELRTIGKKRGEVIDDLEALVRKNASDAEVDAKLKEVAEVEREVVDRRQKFVERIGEILTKQQVARYVVFERNFNQDLRELMRDAALDRRGRN